ncbi:MAG: L-histidine N(alpha)-methyltransferase [Bryobacteraceae bacterium]
MSAVSEVQLSGFAADVIAGLVKSAKKKLPPQYFYDGLGSRLFEAITLLPEYGLTRADRRVLARCAKEIAESLGSPCLVAELGSGSGKKTSHILGAIAEPALKYYPIDVSDEALSTCSNELASFADIEPIHADYLEGVTQLSRLRPQRSRLLLLFLGSSVGNFEPEQRIEFLRKLHTHLRPGDLFLLGVDLVKNIDDMLAAYDDPLGVTASFNMNVLARMNRELQANFNLRAFVHRAVWNACERRIEMHLASLMHQTVTFPSLGVSADFAPGETIWTESSHKFTMEDLQESAIASGFKVLNTWVDEEWPFAESLWEA